MGPFPVLRRSRIARNLGRQLEQKRGFKKSDFKGILRLDECDLSANRSDSRAYTVTAQPRY
jgi:hypothetical protein